MKFLSKLIALSCAVCMVGMVWGADFDIYVFKDKNIWNVAIINGSIIPIGYKPPEETKVEKILDDIPATTGISLALNVINKPTEKSISIDSSEEDYDKKLSFFEKDYLFEPNSANKKPIVIITEALKEYDEKEAARKTEQERLEKERLEKEQQLEQERQIKEQKRLEERVRKEREQQKLHEEGKKSLLDFTHALKILSLAKAR